MQIKSLYLNNFRVYEETFFEFGPKITVVHGPNARGKTSLLEALHYLVAGRSFRGGQTSELIRNGHTHFYLEARFVKHSLEQVLRATCGESQRKFVHNSTVLPSAAHLLGLLQGVAACPNDVALVKGAPLVRRQYLDVQIAQVDPLYVHHLNRYNRALRQRNCLLRARQTLTIESWEHEMAQSASYLTRQRARTVAELQESVLIIHRRLTESKEALSLAYKSSADFSNLESYFLTQYNKHRKREMDLGSTLYGPHKDDLLLAIDGADVRSFASEGQQRTCVFGLRCAEWERLNALSEEPPFMVVDDVALGLDDRRRERMTEYLLGLSQVFLSATANSWAAQDGVQAIAL